MITVGVNVSEGLSPMLNKIVSALDGADAADLNAVGGRSANNAAIEYHEAFERADGWRGKNYLDGPGRESGSFGQNITLGWSFESSDEDGATISNNADFYAFKVTGGTIVPKRVSHLTIPMVSEAAGRRVADYTAATGNILFRVAGKKALFEAVEGGGVRAVYALVKSVVAAPWPEALPDDETISSAFAEGWRGGLADLIEVS